MPRIPRMVIDDETTVYHVMSRTALDGFPLRAGIVSRPEKGKTKVIGDRTLKKDRNREFELSRSDRFRYRTRYFTDSGVIGSKEFVLETYMRFKHYFISKNEKKTKTCKRIIRRLFLEATF